MKTLILYYSYSGNTKKIADMIHEKIGCDIEKIETVVPYDSNYDKVVSQGKTEVEHNHLPETKPLKLSPKDFDTIILGTPVWWYSISPATKSFLKSNDFSGKNIYPFITNGGWKGHSLDDIKQSCPNAKVANSIFIKFDGNKLNLSDDEIENWIDEIQQ